MPRTIVYPRKMKQAPGGAITFGGPGPAGGSGAGSPESSGAGPTSKTQTVIDGYLSKLMKFVPAEVVAFFAPMAAMVEGRRGYLIAATIIAFVATPLYLWLSARSLPADARPLVHLYPLSAIAFLAWAVGTSSVGDLIGLDAIATSFILGTTVFFMPLADGLLTAAQK